MNIDDIFTNFPHYEEMISMWYGRVTVILTLGFSMADQLLGRLKAAAAETPTDKDDEVLEGAQKWLDITVRACRAFSQYKGK